MLLELIKRAKHRMSAMQILPDGDDCLPPYEDGLQTASLSDVTVTFLFLVFMSQQYSDNCKICGCPKGAEEQTKRKSYTDLRGTFTRSEKKRNTSCFQYMKSELRQRMTLKYDEKGERELTVSSYVNFVLRTRESQGAKMRQLRNPFYPKSEFRAASPRS